MVEVLIAELKHHGLDEAERIVSTRQRRIRQFAVLAEKWAKLVENIQRFDQLSMYTVDEYENDIDSRALLAEMQLFLPKEGKAISHQILAPLDEIFFAETFRIEKPVTSTLPEKFLIFYYHIPKRRNEFFLDHLRRLGIL